MRVGRCGFEHQLWEHGFTNRLLTKPEVFLSAKEIYIKKAFSRQVYQFGAVRPITFKTSVVCQSCILVPGNIPFTTIAPFYWRNFMFCDRCFINFFAGTPGIMGIYSMPSSYSSYGIQFKSLAVGLLVLTS